MERSFKEEVGKLRLGEGETFHGEGILAVTKALLQSGVSYVGGYQGAPVSHMMDVLNDARDILDELGIHVEANANEAGAAAMHIEDQVGAKRCGHRPGKELVSGEEMADRVKAAVDARTDPSFVIMARTDALANEGLDAAISRAVKYVEAGADMIFPEAITELAMYRKFAAAVKVPILANITEFGSTPLYTVAELRSADVAIALYPLTAFRAMNKAALKVYETVRKKGTQKDLVNDMQTREELYEFLNYHSYEKKLDELFSRGKSS